MASANPEIRLAHISKKRTHDEASRVNSSAENNLTIPSDNEIDRKKTRLIGPSLPSSEPKGTDITQSQSDYESDSDDDFGPALPPNKLPSPQLRRDSIEIEGADRSPNAKNSSRTQRDAWMLAPPGSSDWTSRIDSTKLRNRKFTSGKTTSASPNQGPPKDLWTETLQQKRDRLQSEVMGLGNGPGDPKGSKSNEHRKVEAGAIDSKIRQYNDINRGTSLVSVHTKMKTLEKDDDPSNRAFDREKDIAAPSKISRAKRKELLDKAADFESRFSRGSYL